MYYIRAMNGTIDAHAHIFPAPIPGDSPNAPRPDQMGDLAAYLGVLDRNGIAGGVLVQPSAYGFDNTHLLAALERSAGRVKGIAVVDPRTTRQELLALKGKGVVGLRFIVAFDRDILKREPERRLLRDLAELDMFAQVMVSARDFVHAKETLTEIPVRIVFDHLGWPNLKKPVDEPGFAEFLKFGKLSRCAVKLSNLVRISREPYPFEDLRPFVAALLEAFTPERCVWGSDWPFIHVEPAALDYGRAVAAVRHLLGDPGATEHVFTLTPRRLFGF